MTSQPGAFTLDPAAAGRSRALSDAGTLVLCAAMLVILFIATFLGGRQRRPGRRSAGRTR